MMIIANLYSMITVKELLQAKTLDQSDLKALLKHTLNCSSVYLILNEDYKLTESEYQQFVKLVKQRENGVPIAYLVGTREFYSRNFIVNPAVLIPRPETELCVEYLIGLTHSGDKILDLGTGSGCIAITCKLENKSLQVKAVDVSPAALAVAWQNAENLHAEVVFFLSEWYTSVRGKFNIIISNPPYISKDDKHLFELSHEPQNALTDFADGLSCLASVIAGAPPFLEHGGYLVVEHGYDQAAKVRLLMQQNGFQQIKTFSDYAGLERFTSGRHW